MSKSSHDRCRADLPGERAPETIAAIIANAKLRPLHFLIFGICFSTSLVDGMDQQLIGFSAAAISDELNLPLSAFGTIYSTGALGGIIGAMIFGTAADRIGRKWALFLATVTFAIMSLLTTAVQSREDLLFVRFVAGLGFGGAIPGMVALGAEYAPANKRGLVVGTLWCGYPTGAAIGGLVTSLLLPEFGWRSIYFFGGGVAVIIAAAQLLLLPESVAFLAVRRGSEARIRSILSRLDPTAGPPIIEKEASTQARPKDTAPLKKLVADGRLVTTLLLWLTLACIWQMMNFLALWMPPFIEKSGYPVAFAAFTITLFNLSGIPSQAGSGHVIDRKGPFGVLLVCSTGVVFAILLLAFGLQVPTIVGGAMLLLGLLLAPCITALSYIAARVYPAEIRSTGLGWMFGIGRFGQVFGSIVVGAAVSAGISIPAIIAGVAGSAATAMMATLLIRSKLTAHTI